MNIPDFTRYAKDQRSQIVGQSIAMPLTMTGFSFIGIAVTAATVDRVTARRSGIRSTLVARLLADLPVLLVLAMVIVVIAQISTNMAANVVSPSNDFSNLSPRQISFRMGGMITAVIGIVSFPWKLYEDVGAYIFTWLVGYGSLLASFLAVMVFDYWLLRRTRLDVAELYRPGAGGEYWFSSGYNVRALVAVAAGVIPVLPGFLHAATTEGGVVADPDFLDQLYRYGVFVAFGHLRASTYVGALAGAAAEPRARHGDGRLSADGLRRHVPDGPAGEPRRRAHAARGALGFTHAWTFDSHILWQEPYVIYAQMLAATERIMVGPFVTNPATRDPTVTASLFATLNDGFGNRTICGIGRGDSARRVLGKPPTTLAADRGGDARDQGARRGPRDRDAGRRGADPVGARRQARRLDGRLRPEGARARRAQGGRLHPPARRPRDPALDGRARARRGARRPGATRPRSRSASRRPPTSATTSRTRATSAAGSAAWSATTSPTSCAATARAATSRRR